MSYLHKLPLLLSIFLAAPGVVAPGVVAPGASSNLTSTNPLSPMSIEYIRYTISSDRHEQFVRDYARAGEVLQASPHCLGYELTQGEEEPDNFILRIEWSSTQDHLEGFRKSEDFAKFLGYVRPYYNDIQEMKHYQPSSVRWEK